MSNENITWDDLVASTKIPKKKLDEFALLWALKLDPYAAAHESRVPGAIVPLLTKVPILRNLLEHRLECMVELSGMLTDKALLGLMTTKATGFRQLSELLETGNSENIEKLRDIINEMQSE